VSAYPEPTPIKLPPKIVHAICKRAIKECKWSIEEEDEVHFSGISGGAWYGQGEYSLNFLIMKDRRILIDLSADIDQTEPFNKFFDLVYKYAKEEEDSFKQLSKAEREKKKREAFNGLVFMSYGHKDKNFAQRLGNDIYIFGIDVWMDLASLRVGDEWPAEIARKINDAQAVVLVGSSEGLLSSWVQKEVSLALKKKKKILPVIYQKTEFPDWFSKLSNSLQYIDMSRQKYGYRLPQLINVIKQYTNASERQV
jgi:TIR domain